MCVFVCVSVCKCVCLCMCVSVYTCMCTFCNRFSRIRNDKTKRKGSVDLCTVVLDVGNRFSIFRNEICTSMPYLHLML